MKTTTFTFERTFNASLEEVWELWTTREGIEAWWGPDGFEVKVLELDLKPQGQLVYAQTAIAAPQMEFLKRAGMPLTTQARITYVEIVAPRRLHYIQLADFIPGTKPYDVNALVELSLRDGKVKMVLTHDTMHDERWTNLARMGWENEPASSPRCWRHDDDQAHHYPFLWFDTQAQEAAKHYTRIFPRSKVTGVAHDAQGRVMTVSFSLNGNRFTALNGGPHFTLNPAILLVVTFARRSASSTRCGRSCSPAASPASAAGPTDKFGVSWQVIPEVVCGKWIKHPRGIRGQ